MRRARSLPKAAMLFFLPLDFEQRKNKNIHSYLNATTIIKVHLFFFFNVFLIIKIVLLKHCKLKESLDTFI